MTGSRCQPMHTHLPSLLKEAYENDGFDVTMRDQDRGPQDLYAHKERTNEPDKSIDIIIVDTINKPGVIRNKIAQLSERPTDIHVVVGSKYGAAWLYDVFHTPVLNAGDTTAVCYLRSQPLLQEGLLTVYPGSYEWLVTATERPQSIDPIISLPIEEIDDYDADTGGDLGLPRYVRQDGHHTVVENGTTVARYESHTELQKAYPTVRLPFVPPQQTNTAITIRLVCEPSIIDYIQLHPKPSSNHPEDRDSAVPDQRLLEWSWIHLVPSGQVLREDR